MPEHYQYIDGGFNMSNIRMRIDMIELYTLLHDRNNYTANKVM